MKRIVRGVVAVHVHERSVGTVGSAERIARDVLPEEVPDAALCRAAGRARTARRTFQSAEVHR
jgi:hypothetical protein